MGGGRNIVHTGLFIGESAHLQKRKWKNSSPPSSLVKMVFFSVKFYFYKYDLKWRRVFLLTLLVGEGCGI